MSKRAKQGSGVMMIAFVLSTPWLAGCGVDADQRPIADRSEDSGYAERADRSDRQGDDVTRSGEKRESFFDRLLADRTREVTVPSGTTAIW